MYLNESRPKLKQASFKSDSDMVFIGNLEFSRSGLAYLAALGRSDNFVHIADRVLKCYLDF